MQQWVAKEHFPSAPRSARTGTEYHTLGTMSVTSFAARLPSGLQGTPRHHQACVKGTRQARHGGRRTLAVVRSAMSKKHHDDADVVSAVDVARHHNTEEGEDNTAALPSAAAPPTSRRELMTAAVSLAATATTAPFVSAASAAEPTLVRGRWECGRGAIECHLESKKNTSHPPRKHRSAHRVVDVPKTSTVERERDGEHSR